MPKYTSMHEDEFKKSVSRIVRFYKHSSVRVYPAICKICKCSLVFIILVLLYFEVGDVKLSMPYFSPLEKKCISPVNQNSGPLLLDVPAFKMNGNVSFTKSLGASTNIRKPTTETKQNITNQIVNPHPFRYLLNPVKFCLEKEIFIITYVHSSLNHFKERETIRETWGSQQYILNKHIKVVFILGKVKDKKVMSSIKNESDRFGDIVQEDFDDSYRNLTYKAIAGLKWVSTFCRHAKYVLKTDDDIFVNMYSLLDYIISHEDASHRKMNFILCEVFVNTAVIRYKNSKWYVTKQEFAQDRYPKYCAGLAYIMSSDVTEKLYKISFYVPFFWVDDCYITGILVHKLNLKHTFYNSRYVNNLIESDENRKKLNNISFIHNIRERRTMVTLWNTLKAKTPENATHTSN